ncbi:MAG: SUF system NifU family Fe-S cluster assembly protein [Treponema sp.]|nr:SUF system NifU family Fe-S cluster assembly protein [Treponema sp.]
MDIKSLYADILNEHNLNPSHKGVLDQPTFTLQGVNPSCGDNIYLQLKLDENNIITDGTFNGSGCAISQASVDMMLDSVIGKSKDEALSLAALFTDMIHGTETDDAKLEALDEAAALKNIRVMPARVKCAVLGWHTMQEMLASGKTAGQGAAPHCAQDSMCIK